MQFLVFCMTFYEGFNENMMIGSIMIDLRKAFDTCKHDKLIKKLQLLGLGDNLVAWFTNYLCNRKQYTDVDGVCSTADTIEVGVPQGSLLGVLLFEIQINDMCNVLKFSTGVLYADDTTLYVVGKNFNHIRSKLQHDIDLVSMWLKSNSLMLNTSKTKTMLFQKDGLNPSLNIVIDNVTIEHVNEFKFLGLWLDTALTFSRHYNELYLKLIKSLFIYGKLSYLPSPCLKNLYFAYFHSHMLYCLPGWANTLNACQVETLFKLQKRVVRIITKSSYMSHSDPLFKSLCIVKFPQMIRHENIKLKYRAIASIAPVVLCNYMFHNATLSGHKIETRSKNYIRAKINYSIYRNCFICKCDTEWLLLSKKYKE